MKNTRCTTEQEVMNLIKTWVPKVAKAEEAHMNEYISRWHEWLIKVANPEVCSPKFRRKAAQYVKKQFSKFNLSKCELRDVIYYGKPNITVYVEFADTFGTL